MQSTNKRFGSIPHWAEERLSKMTTHELEDLSLRLLDAGSLEELLQQAHRAALLYGQFHPSRQRGRLVIEEYDLPRLRKRQVRRECAIVDGELLQNLPVIRVG